MSSPIEKAVFCEGCPKSEAFEEFNKATKSDNRNVQNACRLGVGLLNLAKQTGPSSIITAEAKGTPFCCKQALLGFAEDTLKRTEHAVIKNMQDN